MVLYFIPLILIMFVSFYNSPIQINTLDNFCENTVYSTGTHFAWGFYPLERDQELSFEYIFFLGSADLININKSGLEKTQNNYSPVGPTNLK